MKRILFVDDETNLLEALERMLFPLRKEWKISFAQSGPEALELLKNEPFDVVVSDMRMPGMDGAALLDEIVKKFPQVIRFILSGQTDKQTVYRSVQNAHQFLHKPCNAAILKNAIERAYALRDILQSESLRSIVTQIEGLPPMPITYEKLVNQLNAPETSLRDIGKIIETDLAMTAKILHIVNSAFFGLREQVASASQAVSLLGLETIKTLVLTIGLFAESNSRINVNSVFLENLWHHSLAAGACAIKIAKCEQVSDVILHQAFTGSVLHDTGKLLLAGRFPIEYEVAVTRAAERDIPLVQSEREVFGCSHAEIGAYLLGIWNLPNPIVEAVALHHNPENASYHEIDPLVIVHTADCLALQCFPTKTVTKNDLMNQELLDKLQINNRIGLWRAACNEIAPAEKDMYL